MAHRVSAAALHAARVVLKNYTLEVKPVEELPSGRIPNLEASEKCVAIIIDWMSNIFQVVELRTQLGECRKRMRQGTATAPQVAEILQRLSDAFDALPKESSGEAQSIVTLETPIAFGGKPEQHVISKPSLEAARGIFYYYAVAPKDKECTGNTRVNIAKLIETSTGIARALPAVPVIAQCKEHLKQGHLTSDDIQKYLRRIATILTIFPGYENTQEEVRLL
jgi:hypothetical protein